jgi:[protein-PII] uridylyltransferase
VFCSALGLGEADTALVAWLVQKHLLMSMTAQKQDIGDPDVIHRFALAVADRERLDLLYLLTCADIAGTSPKLWNAWKDRLLADLHTATRLALRRGLEHPVAAADRIAETREAARAQLLADGMDDAIVSRRFAAMPEESFLRARPDQVAWQAAALGDVDAGATRVAARSLGGQAGALDVFVHSPDRDGLFAAIVATLDRAGLAIQQARLLDGPGRTVFDTFEVLPADGRGAVNPHDVERRIADALAQPDLDAVRPTRRAQPRHLRHFRRVPQVDFGASGDGLRTLLSLVCTDRPGLLADVTRVLRDQRLRVHDARIATFGERAEDVFQLTDERDAPLDETQQQALRTALLASLDGESPA